MTEQEEELTCRTCDAEDARQPFEVTMKMPAVAIAYPSLADGYSDIPWPICARHEQLAMIAGWKLEPLPTAKTEPTLESQAQRIHDLEKSLLSLKNGRCWCGLGIGDPRVTSHWELCLFIQKLFPNGSY